MHVYEHTLWVPSDPTACAPTVSPLHVPGDVVQLNSEMQGQLMTTLNWAKRDIANMVSQVFDAGAGLPGALLHVYIAPLVVRAFAAA